jgi:hypothetical protein
LALGTLALRADHGRRRHQDRRSVIDPATDADARYEREARNAGGCPMTSRSRTHGGKTRSTVRSFPEGTSILPQFPGYFRMHPPPRDPLRREW